MSVKKLGTSVLRNNLWREPRWHVSGGDYDFGLDYTANAQTKVKTLLGQSPSSPYYRKNDPKYKKEYGEYQEKSMAYHNKEREIIQDMAREISESSNHQPVRFRLYKNSISNDDASDLLYCLYKGSIYKFDRPGYSDEEMIFQIMELEDKERQKFERLKHKFTLAKDEEKIEIKRMRIPEEVRIAVWRRDEGKCVKCASRERLEYDHIIPLSKGGSDTVRNIELLCEKCNRSKCAEIR